MLRDAHRHDLSGATSEAVGAFDAAVRAFTLVYGDTLGLYDAARAAAPRFVMAHLGKAWVAVPRQRSHPGARGAHRA